jgi:hypothetical protein
MNDVYAELAKDIVAFTSSLSLDQAKEVVRFLRGESLVDYDVLKEYYSDED